MVVSFFDSKCITLLALAVYSRSPCAYKALRSFKLLQLPCVRTLKYYIDANLESTGDSMERLQESRKQYTELIKEKRRLQEENCSKGENVCITSNYAPYIHFYACMKCAGITTQVLLPTGEGSLILDEVNVHVHVY